MKRRPYTLYYCGPCKTTTKHKRVLEGFICQRCRKEKEMVEIKKQQDSSSSYFNSK